MFIVGSGILRRAQNRMYVGKRWTQSNGRVSRRRAEVGDRRTGVLAVKAGMMASWDEHGNRHALTVLHVDGCRVVQVKEADKHGYTGLQVGVCPRKGKHVNRPMMGHFAKWSPSNQVDYPYMLLRRLEEFRISPKAVLPVGHPLNANHFVPGQFVDIQGVTRGKGFQGVMKRHGFAGQPASHGNSKAHRVPGSIGQCATPSKVFKGKKLPGRMGGKRRTIQNLLVHRIDNIRNLIFVRGAIPGARGTIVRVTDSIGKYLKPQMRYVQEKESGKIHFPTTPLDIQKELPPILHYENEPKPAAVF